jgi:hypothetical protein
MINWPDQLRPRDRDLIKTMPGVVSIHPYTASWFNNASFVFPLLAAIGSLIAWATTSSTELLGLAIFFAVVMGLMLPLVYLTWSRTPTTIILRDAGIASLHQGRPLKTLGWSEIVAVTKKDTMGNVRWYISAENEEYISVEGEIDQIDELLANARRLAGLSGDAEAG